jgi:hypothetical protein
MGVGNSVTRFGEDKVPMLVLKVGSMGSGLEVPIGSSTKIMHLSLQKSIDPNCGAIG